MACTFLIRELLQGEVSSSTGEINRFPSVAARDRPKVMVGELSKMRGKVGGMRPLQRIRGPAMEVEAAGCVQLAMNRLAQQIMGAVVAVVDLLQDARAQH